MSWWKIYSFSWCMMDLSRSTRCSVCYVVNIWWLLIVNCPFAFFLQTTGVPIRACKRAQLNVILKRVSGFPWVKPLTKTITMWFEMTKWLMRLLFFFFLLSKTRFLNETIFPIMYVNEVSFHIIFTFFRFGMSLKPNTMFGKETKAL